MSKRGWGSTERRQGQGLVEYGLILVLIMVAVVVMVALFGTQVNNLFSSIVSAVGNTLP